MDKSTLIIGMMSGTSGDGIDTVLVSFDEHGIPELKNTLFNPYPQNIRDSIFELATADGELNQEQLDKLDQILGEQYAKAVNDLIRDSKLDASSISAIANHGQTIKHSPNSNPPWSLQLGKPQYLAEQTGIRVISQFRQNDLKHGGQGAPLMPAFHQHLLQRHLFQKNWLEEQDSIAVINIGGIANVSIIGNDSKKIIGFDSGPGNTLLDQWIKQQKDLEYDKNGDWARTGKVQPELLATLLSDPYFSQDIPKSTGPDYFNLQWLETVLLDFGNIAPADVQATLLELTASSITNAINQYSQNSSHAYVCGGGWHNAYLLERLNSKCECTFQSTELLGAHPDWMEAIGFAWLGYCFLNDIPSNLPSVTGAEEEVVLGELFHS